MREPNLAAWQWSLYPDGHRDRRNLLIHLATQPIFFAATGSLLAAPFAPWLFLAAPAVMAAVMALQGRGHRREATPPVPFDGPLDVAGRIFLEQLFTFPRFVLSGGLARAWRESGGRHGG
jgi:hypothetical protein